MTKEVFISKFNNNLEQYLDEKLKDYQEYITDEYFSLLMNHLKVLLLSGGKRIRPYMAYLMYQCASGKQEEEVIQFVIGLELFHFFCLMHDDVIDKGEKRHGVPTLHVFAKEKMKQENRVGDLEHISNGEAMLLGDLVFSWANEILYSQKSFQSEYLNNSRRFFQKMVDEVILGELFDVDLMTRELPSRELVFQKTYLKTATYTFIRPMQIGAALAGKNGELESFAQDFGKVLGIAFQIQDDYLDLMGDSKNVKKPLFSDLKDRQHTLFTQYIFDHGKESDKEELLGYFGKEIHEGDYTNIRELFNKTGAFSEVLKQMNQYFDQAEVILERVEIANDCKNQFRDLLLYIKNRKA